MRTNQYRNSLAEEFTAVKAGPGMTVCFQQLRPESGIFAPRSDQEKHGMQTIAYSAGFCGYQVATRNSSKVTWAR